jgi:hypothetical protein
VTFAFLLALGAVAQEPEVTTDASTEIPVKGTIQATGSVELLFTMYAREHGGRALYSVTARVAVEENTYFGDISVPDEVFRGRQTVYIEAAMPSAPAIALEARSQFTKPGGRPAGRANRATTILGCSLCYTCGGSYPIFSGAFVTPGLGTKERGPSCSGNVSSRVDFRPHLCCQNVRL